MVLCGSLWFLVVVGGCWWFLVVLCVSLRLMVVYGGSWWLILVFGGLW